MECHSVANTFNLVILHGKKDRYGYIPGKENIHADRESRVFSDNKEWMLSAHLFQHITDTLREPTIDLFASRLN